MKLSVKDVARRLFTHPNTISRLVLEGVIEQPEPAEPRGWSADKLPSIMAAVEANREAARAARIVALERATEARRQVKAGQAA